MPRNLLLVPALLGILACEAPAGRASADDAELAAAAPVSGPVRTMTHHGGQVLANAKLYPIVWRDDAAFGAEITGFFRWLVQSPYWSHLAEYGVGPGSVGDLVVLDEPPPASFDDAAIVGPTIRALIAQGRLPPSDENSGYVFMVPASTRVPPGTGGYHSVSDGFVYQAMTRTLKEDGSIDFDDMTNSFSHEIAEMVTDPRADDTQWTGWYSDEIWFGEVGDLCNNLSVRSMPIAEPDGGAPRRYKLSRLYSNRQAGQGLDPCVPAAGSYAGVKTSPSTLAIAVDAAGNGEASYTLTAFAADPSMREVNWEVAWVNPEGGVFVVPNHGTMTPGTTMNVTVRARGAKTTSLALGLLFVTQEAHPGNDEWNAGEVAQWNTEVSVANPGAAPGARASTIHEPSR